MTAAAPDPGTPTRHETSNSATSSTSNTPGSPSIGRINSSTTGVLNGSGVATSTPPRRTTLDSERWLDILTTAGGIRGAAVSALGQHLVDKHRAHSILEGAELAADLLATETDAALEALTTLIRDGWDDTLGKLLASARIL